MASVYPGIKLNGTNTTFKDGKENSPLISKVVSKLKSLPNCGQVIRINTENVFQRTDSYDEFNVITHVFEKRRVIHFQSVLRLNKGNYFVLSGGDNKEAHCSHLFIVNINAYLQNRKERSGILNGPIGVNTNYSADNQPKSIDKLVELFKLDEGKYWHAGGMSSHNNLLAVPVEYENDENDYGSEIRFIDLTNPEKPKNLPKKTVIKRNMTKAGAVALVRLPNGRYICGIWSDSDKKDKGIRKLDLYYSKTDKISDGFEDRVIHWGYSLLKKSGHHPQYQSIQFILQDNGKLFLIGIENSSSAAPILGSNINRLRAYELNFPGQDILSQNFNLVNPSIQMVYERTFEKGGKYYNFDSGNGIYVTPENNLALYSTHHWMKDGYISIAEFYPPYDKISLPLTELDQSEIHLYENKDFTGRCLKLYGITHSFLPKYNRVIIDGKTLDEKVSSIKYLLPKGAEYTFFKEVNFNNNTANQEKFTIKGTGNWKKISDLDKVRTKSFDDCISSSKIKKT